MKRCACLNRVPLRVRHSLIIYQRNLSFSKRKIVFNRILPDGTRSPETEGFLLCMRCAVEKYGLRMKDLGAAHPGAC